MTTLSVELTEAFREWLTALRDRRAAAAIARRIDRMRRGNFGDHHSVGGGVSELRVDFGPGYRVYYVVRRRTVVLLLCGGDKSSQSRDVERAHRMAEEI